MDRYSEFNLVDPTTPQPTGEFRVVGVRVDTGPTVEPLTVAQAKAHLRVDGNDDDTLIEALIAEARLFVENQTGLALLEQTFTASLDNFPRSGKIELPRAPVTEIVEFVYDDENDVEREIDAADYRLDLITTPARIMPSRDGVWATGWPCIPTQTSAVRIQFKAGADDVAGVNPQAVRVMLLLIGHFYENREATISGTIITDLPNGLQTLVRQLKVHAHR